MASKFIRGIFKKITGGKTSPTIKSVKPNVGNLKKNQETFSKFKTTTDKYVTAAKEKGFKDLAKELRKSGSKSLQKSDKILRKNKRIGKMGGGMMDNRMGYSKGSKKGKVPTTSKEKAFGMLSVKKGLDNNKNITFTDKIAGAKKS